MIPPAWKPSLLAVALGLGMIWLAGAPFEAPAGFPADALIAPRGDHASFPDRFEWRPVPAATEYEVSVVREGRLVFRQRGPSTVLAVEMAPGGGPGPGDYEWAVVARRGRATLDRASGSFRVTAP